MEEKQYKFYGTNGYCFKLGPNVYEVIEDEDDGYRSSMKDVKLLSKEEAKNLNFFRTSIATVIERDSYEGYFDGTELVDVEDGHVWLKYGTENYDDWYPMFTFKYKPKPPKS